MAWLARPGDATDDRVAAELDLALAVSRAQAGAVARVRPSVVSILAFSSGSREYGAGILVDSKGLVLTALHVVEEAAALSVRTADDQEYVARLIAEDEPADLALLEILTPRRTFPVAPLGREETVRVGETVFVIGNPFGLHATVTRGVLSGRGRTRVVKDNVAALLQTDAVINPGSSGGALVNLHGEVIGMVNAILTRSGTHQGMGFAVPVSELRRALPFLLTGSKVKRAWIGVRVQRTERGLEVTSVVAGGPAAGAGLEAGDLISGLASVGELRALVAGQP